MYEKSKKMFKSVQFDYKNQVKNNKLRLGTNLANQHVMKQSISAKELTLLVGILVALIISFVLVSTSSVFLSEISNVPVPGVEIPILTKVVLKKIMSFF